MNIDKINEKVNNFSHTLPSFKIDSIFLEQNDKLDKIFYNHECLHELRSVSKLIVALAVGIAIDQKKFTLDTEIYPVIKSIVKIKNLNNIEKIKKWNIRNLLTHTTGYKSQMMSEKFIKDIDKDSLLDYALNYDLPYEVGERFSYNNVEPFIFSVFFQEKFGLNLADFINENIFKKLEIYDFKWENYGKYCPGATGLYMKHSDFHKIGQLLLHDGIYNGNQVISKDWIKEMCSMQLKTPDMYKKERVLPKIGVGYYTFISRDNFIFRDGSNGQYIIFSKEQNLLITIMASETEMKNITEILRDLI